MTAFQWTVVILLIAILALLVFVALRAHWALRNLTEARLALYVTFLNRSQRWVDEFLKGRIPEDRELDDYPGFLLLGSYRVHEASGAFIDCCIRLRDLLRQTAPTSEVFAAELRLKDAQKHMWEEMRYDIALDPRGGRIPNAKAYWSRKDGSFDRSNLT